MRLSSIVSRVMRRKHFEQGSLATPLRRCLTTLDISLLGVGHMIGAGIYVLTGSVIRNTAGPSIVLSFLFSGIAAFLSALCYAELGARFPKAGSAYTYTYVGCGELVGFVVGWNIVLEHMLGSAAVARSWSGYLDALTGNAISNFTLELVGSVGVEDSLIAHYPDVVAVVVVVVISTFIGIGPKTATSFNAVFTVTNLLAVSFVVVYGATLADFSLWQGEMAATGHSRFMPFGWDGVLAGAASCFFAFVGFDGLATAGEEAKTIPHATFICMVIVTASYILMSGVLSLMVPFEQVHPTASFADAFENHGAQLPRLVVSVSGLCGMTTSLFGGLFALPRSVYAMAEDGLLFHCWAVVNRVTRTPMNSIITFTILTALLALLFDVGALVDFLSIAGELRVRSRALSWCAARVGEGRSVPALVVILAASLTACGVLLSTGVATEGGVVGGVALALCAIIAIIAVICIDLHRQNDGDIAFKVSFVPYLPAASLLVNVLMMTHLSVLSWLRIAVWMTIG